MKISRAIARRKPFATNNDGSVQKSPSSKAAALFARGAYWYYVSTEKGRERRWRLFSTDPISITAWALKNLRMEPARSVRPFLRMNALTFL